MRKHKLINVQRKIIHVKITTINVQKISKMHDLRTSLLTLVGLVMHMHINCIRAKEQ